MLKHDLIAVLSDEHGTSLIEYALLGMLVAVVAVGALTTFGLNLRAKYDAIAALFP